MKCPGCRRITNSIPESSIVDTDIEVEGDTLKGTSYVHLDCEECGEEKGAGTAEWRQEIEGIHEATTSCSGRLDASLDDIELEIEEGPPKIVEVTLQLSVCCFDCDGQQDEEVEFEIPLADFS